MLKKSLPKYWLFLVVLISSCGNKGSQEFAIEEIYGRWEFEDLNNNKNEFWINSAQALRYNELKGNPQIFSYRVKSDTVFLEVKRGDKNLVYDFFIILSLEDEELELSNAGHQITLKKVAEISTDNILEQFKRNELFE